MGPRIPTSGITVEADKERQERELKRQATRSWRRKLYVDMANDAIEGNREAGLGREYLSPAFRELIKDFIK